LIKCVHSAIKQSNKLIPIFKFGQEGKIFLQDSQIEWDNSINYQNDFKDAIFIHFENIELNHIPLSNYHFEKQ
jgi:hypothetical protein